MNRIKNLKTIRTALITDKRVIVRVDFNEPMVRGRVSDDFRIRASLPTIRKLLAGNNQLVVISHLGRPDGKKRPEFSMKPIARHLGSLLGHEVIFIADPFLPRHRTLFR